MAASARKTTPEEVGLRYLALGYHLRRVVDEGMTAGGLSLARTKVLQALDRLGAVRQSTLAQELGQAPRSVTQSLEALDRAGLVERAADPDDGRSKLVRLPRRSPRAQQRGEKVLQEVFG